MHLCAVYARYCFSEVRLRSWKHLVRFLRCLLSNELGTHGVGEERLHPSQPSFAPHSPVDPELVHCFLMRRCEMHSNVKM